MKRVVWDFSDAYGDIDSAKFKEAFENLEALILEARNLASKKEGLNLAINAYELAFGELNSLLAFCRCKASNDVKDERASAAEIPLLMSGINLEKAKLAIFNAIDKLEGSNLFFKSDEFKKIKPLYDEYKNSYQRMLSTKSGEIYDQISLSNFAPLYGIFRHLNNLISVKAVNSSGEESTYSYAKCAGVLKGSPDQTLRKSVFCGLKEHYEKHANLYADLLNMLAGFRLNKFNAAKTDFLTPSLEQNKISKDTLDAMFEAVCMRLEKIRECVSLRAKYFPDGEIYACDLLAPSPFASKDKFSYEEAINLILAALSKLGIEACEFVNMMLEKGWIEAEVRDNKAAGAFCVWLGKFKQPRLFSSYTGALSHVIQQAHELGHAWHYWLMRDICALHQKPPMSLAECASTFNEALLRNHLRKSSSDDKFCFDILWQELKSAANFMLNIGVRYEFESAFLKARQNGVVSVKEIENFIQMAWDKFYGETTKDSESILPYFKLHFYKTDQYIYNYPYMIGYLISQFLISEFENDSCKFLVRYKAFLIDSGVMSVEDLLQKHFKKDARRSEFWLQCVDHALGYADEFKKLEKKINF